MFSEILSIMHNSYTRSFEEACSAMEKCINSGGGFIDLLRQISIIPESIAHDSTEEKLFSKASDFVLARAFRELGLKSAVIKARADSADVIAESRFHGYSLAADANAFRLSRTAKNQKDFKVSALSAWRRDNDYAVLCAPYFQYPAKNSQIYSQALSSNVCLLSWEHLIFMIEHCVKETAEVNLSAVWDFSNNFSHRVLVSDIKKNFLREFNSFLTELIKADKESFTASLMEQISAVKKRSTAEKSFRLGMIEQIKSYSREQAVNELINSLRINEKIAHIDTYINSLPQ